MTGGDEKAFDVIYSTLSAQNGVNVMNSNCKGVDR